MVVVVVVDDDLRLVVNVIVDHSHSHLASFHFQENTITFKL